MVNYMDNNGIITVKLLKAIGIIIKKQTNKHTQNPVRYMFKVKTPFDLGLHLDLYIVFGSVHCIGSVQSSDCNSSLAH